jgi:hypothetical protein
LVYTIYVTFFCFYLEALKPEKSRANNVLVKMGLKGRVQNFAATPTQRVQRPKEVKGFSLGGGVIFPYLKNGRIFQLSVLHFVRGEIAASYYMVMS